MSSMFIFRLGADDLPGRKWLAKFEVANPFGCCNDVCNGKKKCGCMCLVLEPVAEPKSENDMFSPKRQRHVDRMHHKKRTHARAKQQQKNETHFTSECALIVNLSVACAFFQFVIDADHRWERDRRRPNQMLFYFVPSLGSCDACTCWLICFRRKHNIEMVTQPHTSTHTEALTNLASYCHAHCAVTAKKK